jgi:hypothetical protein
LSSLWSVTPLEELVKHKQSTYGVEALCKPCSRALAHQWYHDPKNRDRALQTRRDYVKAHREELNRAKLVWQQEHKEEYYARHTKWREANREKLQQFYRDWRAANPDKNREYARTARRKNPEKQRVRVRNRRARKRSAPGKHTAADIQHQYESQKGLCYWCSQPLNGKYHADHILPLIRGGSNFPENIACTCETCNCAKGDRLIYTEWQPPQPLFPEKHRD